MKTALFFKRTIHATLIAAALVGGRSAFAEPKLTNVVATLLSPSPISAGTTGIYQVVAYKGTGANNFFGVLSTTNSLPSGATVNFNPASLNFNVNGVMVATGQMTVALSPSFMSTNFNICVRVVSDGASGDFAVNCGTSVSSVSTNPPSCSVSGPSNACPNTAGLTYTDTTDAATPRFSWSVTGNGSIVGATTNASVSVTSGAAGSFTATCQVIDLANNKTNTCNQIVSVADSTPPTITCPANVSVNADSGQCSASGVSLGSPVTSDNCGVASVTNNAPASFPVGTNTVTWTVVDNNGNSNTCQQTVTVTDDQVPTITCPGTVNVSADPGVCFASGVALGSPITGDNCGVADVSNDAPSTFPVGSTIVTWTVTDVHGNTASCQQTVTVTDDESPSITCPADVSVDTDTDACSASGVNLGTPTTGDNCGIASVTNNAPASFPVGTNAFTWTATDVHGNTANCQQIVVVADNQPPTILCPADVVTNITDACSITNIDLGTPVTADNCGVASVVNDAPTEYFVGTTNVLWTVTDVHGNSAICTQLVTVVDGESPAITCPTNVTVNTDAGLCTASGVDLGSPIASDNCSDVTITNDAPVEFPVGDTIVTWTATDDGGNTNTCQQTVTVIDNEAPTITCPSDVAVNTDDGECTASGVDLGTPITDDNCGVADVSNDAPVTFPAGNTIVTWTVVDIHGNSNSCQQTVTVTDGEAPSITCPSDVAVSTDPGVCTASGVDLGTPTTGDNCGVANASNDAPVTFPAGSTIVTWTVIDVHSNTATCQQTVMVSDNEAPTITCPGNVVVTAPPGSNSVSGVDLGTPTTGDNCGVASVVNDAPGSFPIGDTMVTWTVTDTSDNTATCEQTVTVLEGDVPPVANDDSYTVGEDDILEVAAPGVLANDVDDSPLTAILVSTTTNGVLTLNADGSFTYVPNDNFNGTDSFTYKANDGVFDSNVATVTITVISVDGAGDIDLYAKTASFKVNWASTGNGNFKLNGKINPRGSTNDLLGATMQISINGTNLYAPVTLNSAGIGSAIAGSTKIKAKFKSTTGLYSYTINGIDLRNAIGLPNTTGSGMTPLHVVLTIAFADLQVTPVSGVLETPFSTTAGKFSKGKFVFKKNRTLTGAFNWNKTTALQTKDGSFKVNGKGVAENEGGTSIAPTGNIRVTIGESVFTIPAANVKFTLNGTARTFKINASGLTATGIPLASANAPTVHELPIMFEVPVTGGTNIFETIIELKRSDGTSTKWKR